MQWDYLLQGYGLSAVDCGPGACPRRGSWGLRFVIWFVSRPRCARRAVEVARPYGIGFLLLSTIWDSCKGEVPLRNAEDSVPYRTIINRIILCKWQMRCCGAPRSSRPTIRRSHYKQHIYYIMQTPTAYKRNAEDSVPYRTWFNHITLCKWWVPCRGQAPGPHGCA